MNAPTTFTNVNLADLEVGTEVTVVSTRGWGHMYFTDAKVAKVGKATVTLDNGKVFNAKQAGGWTFHDEVGNLRQGERKTKSNEFPDESARVCFRDDRYLATLKANQETRKEREAAASLARTAAQAAYQSLTPLRAREALDALQAYLDLHN